MERLREGGLAENTVIIFTSDNGWFAGERGLADKWFIYEESIRVPMIVYDPRLPKEKRGRVVEAMTLNIDFAPTMLAMAGVTVPQEMQGRSLGALIAGERVLDWRKSFLFEHNYGPQIIPPSEGVRTEKWSYLRWLAPNPEVEELYDLENDRWQERNLAGDPEHAAKLGELRAEVSRMREELK